MKALGYTFHDEALLRLALVHKSMETAPDDNQRLEFLGDAVFQLLSSEVLFARHPDAPEGEMTRMRAELVCKSSLAQAARSLGIGQYLKMSRGVEMTGGRDKDSSLGDAMEAVLAAVYLDGGLEAARAVAGRALNDFQVPNADKNWKGLLQEHLQRGGGATPEYRIVSMEGPVHARVFTAQAVLGEQVLGEGQGTSKQRAEQQAAHEAVNQITKGENT